MNRVLGYDFINCHGYLYVKRGVSRGRALATLEVNQDPFWIGMLPLDIGKDLVNLDFEQHLFDKIRNDMVDRDMGFLNMRGNP